MDSTRHDGDLFGSSSIAELIPLHFDGNVKIIDCDGERSDDGGNLTCNYLPAYGFASVCVSVKNSFLE